MHKLDKIDYSKLLGFEAVSDRISGSVDFLDETIGATLGAKVGGDAETEPTRRSEMREIKFSRLLGFDAVSDRVAGGVNFRDETIGAKLGAKVGADGEPEPSRRSEMREIRFSKLLGFDAVSDQIAGGVNFRDETIGAKLGAKVGDGEPGPSRDKS
jgi:hypothetical protein